jgi:23S rRNA pseudouridine2605 synthase
MKKPNHAGLSRPPQNAAPKSGKAVGLARALSKLGFCSRSRAVEFIVAGHVTVNGSRCRNPESPVRLERDQIAVQGTAVRLATNTYVMLNKPRGVVTTAADERGRRTVYDCLGGDRPGSAGWLAPVGRLDKASEGLLLLTNDSEWGARITAPATHLEKTYHVQIGAAPSDQLLRKLERGILAQGEMLRAKRVSALRRGQRNAWIAVVLEEGKNRHIRRMLEALQIQVLRLVRVAIGPLNLGDLAKGEWRMLSPAEKAALDRAMGTRAGPS